MGGFQGGRNSGAEHRGQKQTPSSQVKLIELLQFLSKPLGMNGKGNINIFVTRGLANFIFHISKIISLSQDLKRQYSCAGFHSGHEV